MTEAQATETQVEEQAVEVNEAELPVAANVSAGGPPGQIDILLDTTMPVKVNLGQVELTVSELLELGRGSVIKLDKRAGEPVNLYLRGIEFATGHLVVVGDRLGVRIDEIISASPAAKGQ